MIPKTSVGTPCIEGMIKTDNMDICGYLKVLYSLYMARVTSELLPVAPMKMEFLTPAMDNQSFALFPKLFRKKLCSIFVND